MTSRYHRHLLNFKKPSGTSRGVLTEKETWFIVIEDQGKQGIGECGVLRGLSVDDRPDYEEKLRWVCEKISLGRDELLTHLQEFPSIAFGVETAFASIEGENPFVLFPSEFTAGIRGIDINGLVWMGSREDMRNQILEKLEAGFECIKMKIGAIDFNEELELLRLIRTECSRDIEIRVDANGAFSAVDALDKLNQLSEFRIHSIEQPIAVRQYDALAELCEKSPIPIALDEELIGVFSSEDKQELLNRIKPQFIILKPSLVGGMKGSDEWIAAASKYNIGWWVTSALESNIGLNAIAQWTFTKKSAMPQGLGTGSLYTNNFESPLTVEKGKLFYRPAKPWEVSF